MAEKIVKHNKEVILKGQTLSQEEVIEDLRTGKLRYFTVLKSPLRDEDGKIIGLIGNSIEITAEKEAERLQRLAERLQHENEIKMQRLIVEEKIKLITLAHKVAHDISSPLSALNMMMQFCDELPESKRSMIKRATESILDIANNLLNTYRNEEQRAAAGIEQPQPVLISDLIVQLLSEKNCNTIVIRLPLKLRLPVMRILPLLICRQPNLDVLCPI